VAKGVVGGATCEGSPARGVAYRDGAVGGFDEHLGGRAHERGPGRAARRGRGGDCQRSVKSTDSRASRTTSSSAIRTASPTRRTAPCTTAVDNRAISPPWTCVTKMYDPQEAS